MHFQLLARMSKYNAFNMHEKICMKLEKSNDGKNMFKSFMEPNNKM